MRLLDLFRRHFLDDLVEAERCVDIARDGRERVPGIGPHEVWRGHPEAQLIVPTDPRRRARVPLHSRTEIPVEGAGVVLFDPKAKGIHHPDELFGFGVARPRGGPKRLARLFEPALFHQVARLFQFGGGKAGQQRNRAGKGERKNKGNWAHGLVLCLIGAGASADPLGPDDFPEFDPAQAAIGQLLFYDKILSGNRNISCGTCHHHALAGTDGLSLGIGEGGVGLGPERTAGEGTDRIIKRIPRNAPALWNLGAHEVDVLFHDGRLSESDLFGNGFNSPAEEWLPQGLNHILSAQALLPLTAQFEMAGSPGENEIIQAVRDRIDLGWPMLADRVSANPEYARLFAEAFDHVERPGDITIVEIGNALGAFIGSEWQSFDSPYDLWLAGEADLPADAERGRALFFGSAGCVACHSGPLFTDHEFRALGLPAFGPGRTRQWEAIARDVGRMAESNALEDAYRFRTPSLRNVALTAPYGHNGAYPSLRDMLAHHSDPAGARESWTPEMAALPEAPWLAAIDFVVQQDAAEMARQAAALDITPLGLTESEIDDLVAFLHALTGTTAEDRPLGVPDSVPSGLPVDNF